MLALSNWVVKGTPGTAGKAALLGSVRELCGSEHLADVCLVVSGKRMPAHRHVLAPHSRVFERMWSHSMAEVHLSICKSCNVGHSAPTCSILYYLSRGGLLADAFELTGNLCRHMHHLLFGMQHHNSSLRSGVADCKSASSAGSAV